MKKILILTTILIFTPRLTIFAQENSTKTEESKLFSKTKHFNKIELVLLAGIIQPALLNGGNFEVDLYTPKMVFNYSHGFLLNLNSKLNNTTGDVKNQNLAIHIPYSTGFGIGYRFNKYIDVRIEPKLHKFEIYYDGTDRTLSENKITDYSTITLGMGAYFRWRPFEKMNNPLNGIFASTSLRFWPRIFSTLENNEVEYFNNMTEQIERHKTSDIGIANSPFIFNVAIGYAIDFNLKRN